MFLQISVIFLGQNKKNNVKIVSSHPDRRYSNILFYGNIVFNAVHDYITMILFSHAAAAAGVITCHDKKLNNCITVPVSRTVLLSSSTE